MIYDFEIEGVFISELNDNKKLPSEQQIKINWKLPRPGQKYKIIQSSPAVDELGKPILDEDGKPCKKVDCNMDELLKSCAIQVENVFVKDKKITSGIELAEAPLYDLADEFGCFMLEKIQKAFNIKN